MKASDNGFIEIVKMLVEHKGIDINAKDILIVLLRVYFNYFISQNNI